MYVDAVLCISMDCCALLFMFTYVHAFLWNYLTGAVPPNRPPSPIPLTRCPLSRRPVDLLTRWPAPRAPKRSLRAPRRSPRSPQEHPRGPQEGLKSTKKEPKTAPTTSTLAARPRCKNIEFSRVRRKARGASGEGDINEVDRR